LLTVASEPWRKIIHSYINIWHKGAAFGWYKRSQRIRRATVPLRHAHALTTEEATARTWRARARPGAASEDLHRHVTAGFRSSWPPRERLDQTDSGIEMRSTQGAKRCDEHTEYGHGSAGVGEQRHGCGPTRQPLGHDAGANQNAALSRATSHQASSVARQKA